jgi:nicotinamidase-related amidase
VLPEPFDVKSTAVLSIDLHRGYLDPTVSSRPIASEKIGPIVHANARLHALARERGMPIIHAVLSPENLRGQRDPRLEQPLYRWQHARGRRRPPMLDPVRAPAGRNGADVQPELAPHAGDFVIDSKSSMSCFYATELDRLLHTLRVDTLLIGGINTNTCVQNAAFEAMNRDLKTVLVSDCMHSMYGDDLHVLGLQNVARCLGWILTNDEFEEKIEAGAKIND